MRAFVSTSDMRSAKSAFKITPLVVYSCRNHSNLRLRHTSGPKVLKGETKHRN